MQSPSQSCQPEKSELKKSYTFVLKAGRIKQKYRLPPFRLAPEIHKREKLESSDPPVNSWPRMARCLLKSITDSHDCRPNEYEESQQTSATKRISSWAN